MNRTTWAEHHCRTCPRPEDHRGQELGIPAGAFLIDGVCPECGTAALPVDVCQVCGGPASVAADFWPEVAGYDVDMPALVDLLEIALDSAEAEVREHALPRSELSRLMRFLYGKRHKRFKGQRARIRFYFREYLSGRAMGRRLHEAETQEGAKKAADAAKAKRGR